MDKHKEQSREILQIQKEAKHIDSYKETVAVQENIINKLESLLQQKLGDLNDTEGKFDVFERLMNNLDRKENQDINNKLISPRKLKLFGANIETIKSNLDLEKEIENSKAKKYETEEKIIKVQEERKIAKENELKLIEESKLLEKRAAIKQKNNAVTEYKDNKQVIRLIDLAEVELQSKTYRMQALEEQLNITLAENAREIASLRMKLFEFEMKQVYKEKKPDDDGEEKAIEDLNSNAEIKSNENDKEKEIIKESTTPRKSELSNKLNQSPKLSARSEEENKSPVKYNPVILPLKEDAIKDMMNRLEQSHYYEFNIYRPSVKDIKNTGNMLDKQDPLIKFTIDSKEFKTNRVTDGGIECSFPDCFKTQLKEEVINNRDSITIEVFNVKDDESVKNIIGIGHFNIFDELIKIRSPEKGLKVFNINPPITDIFQIKVPLKHNNDIQGHVEFKANLILNYYYAQVRLYIYFIIIFLKLFLLLICYNR
jgi:hypothetical protein